MKISPKLILFLKCNILGCGVVSGTLLQRIPYRLILNGFCQTRVNSYGYRPQVRFNKRNGSSADYSWVISSDCWTEAKTFSKFYYVPVRAKFVNKTPFLHLVCIVFCMFVPVTNGVKGCRTFFLLSVLSYRRVSVNYQIRGRMTKSWQGQSDRDAGSSVVDCGRVQLAGVIHVGESQGDAVTLCNGSVEGILNEFPL